MATKNIPDPTSTSPIVLDYQRLAVATVRGDYTMSGAENSGGPIAATAAVDTLIDTLVATTTGYTPVAGDQVRVIADMIGLSIQVTVYSTTVDIALQYRQAKFTAGMRTAAQNAIGQALTDGLLVAMGF